MRLNMNPKSGLMNPNSNVLKLALGAGCLAATALTLCAGPLRRADVAADPVWVAHLDFDGLRSTSIGQYIQSELEKPEAQAKLAAFQAVFSFDLRTQLHGVTLYSTGPSPQQGVLVLYADFDPARLVTLARAAKDAQSVSYRQHTIYNWLDEKKKHDDGRPRIYAAIAGPRVIFGQREDTVQHAVDVVDGATPSLASTRSFAQLGAAGDRSFIEAAARKIDFSGSNQNAAILRLAKSALLQVSGAQLQLTATLTLEANDEEVAGNMASIGQGLIALLKMQTGKPEAAKLASALSLKQDGPQVLVTLSIPDHEAVDLLKANAARRAERQAQKAEQE
jgi:hypothetical protein